MLTIRLYFENGYTDVDCKPTRAVFLVHQWEERKLVINLTNSEGDEHDQKVIGIEVVSTTD